MNVQCAFSCCGCFNITNFLVSIFHQDSGHPSVRVPQEHMSEGLSDTDTVIYISVTFTDAAVPTEPFARSAPYLHGGEAGPVFRGSTRKKTGTTLILVLTYLMLRIKHLFRSRLFQMPLP